MQSKLAFPYLLLSVSAFGCGEGHYAASTESSEGAATVGVDVHGEARPPAQAFGSTSNRTAILNPDWLPESSIAATPIPSTGDFYVATSGNDANPGTIIAPFRTIQKAVNSATAGSVILVRGGTYNQRVTFTSANSGLAGRYVTLAEYRGENAILDGRNITLPPLGGLVEISGRYIRISGFTVQNVGGTNSQMGILINFGSHIVIDNNYTVRTASAGIGAWYATSFIIRNNRIQDARITGEQECLSVNDGSNFEVSFNEVWNTRAWIKKCEGLDIKNGARFGRVVGNMAHDLPLECIYIDAYQADTHDVDVYANTSYNCSMGIAMTSEETGALRNIRVFNNLIYDTFYIGIGFPAWNESSNAGAISNISIYNNTIDNARAQYTTNPTGLYFAYPNMSNITVRNNIVTTPGTAFTFDRIVTGVVADHNLVVAPTVSSSEMTVDDPFMIRANPRWTNGYHLSGTSPAVSAGSSSVALSFDYDGKPRPQGIGLDIGAFEYSP
jgi:hypothetical protein